MDRTDRLLLEHQINDLDGMIRQMTNMRSVLVRRTNRMLASAPPRLPGRASMSSASVARPHRDRRSLRSRDATSRLEATLSLLDPNESTTNPPFIEDDGGSRSNPGLPSEALTFRPSWSTNSTRQAHIIEQIDPNLMEHWGNNVNEENVNHDVARALVRLFDDEADDEIRRVQQYVPPPPRSPVNSVPLPVLYPPVPYPFVRIVSKPKQKVTVIKHADLVRTMPEPCSICQESYTKLVSVTANCGHGCCKGCMTQWLETKHAAGQNATCPMCRVKVTMVTGYRERAKSVRKVAVASSSNSSVEDEDDVNSMDVVVDV